MAACGVKVCRICFTMDCELLHLHENMNLYKGYEAVTGLMLADEEDLPPYLCASCADRLMNFVHFKNRSLQAHSLLLDIVKNHDHISVESIQVIKTTHGDTDIGQTEDERTLGDVKMEIKRKDIPIDVIVKQLRDEIETECMRDDVGADDYLVGDKVAPSVVEANDIVKEGGFEASVNFVDDSELGTGEDGSLDDGPSEQDKSNKIEARKGTRIKKGLGRTEDTDVDEKPIQNVKMCCDLCGYEIDNELHFLRHLRAHAENKLHDHNTSDSKAESNKTKTAVTVHNVTHLCDVCGESFSSENVLNYHLLVTHSSDGPYKCNICAQTLSQEYYLKQHMVIHYRRKPHTCDVCKKTFIYKASLHKHMRIHLGDKPHSCHLCKKSFTHKASLQKHLHVHIGDKPYSCDVCKKSFHLMEYLKRHLQTHFGDRPYSCDVCKTSYRFKRDLQRHMSGRHSVETQ